jgi:5-bromo-4-chloroindolyl phosphate hydrolysis protein
MDMESVSGDEREIRAARNQALFRAVNEKLVGLNEAFVSATDTFVIACECADVTCVATLNIPPDAYREVRANPRRFAVLEGHVYADVEKVVGEADEYVVVEKIASAAKLAEDLAP